MQMVSITEIHASYHKSSSLLISKWIRTCMNAVGQRTRTRRTFEANTIRALCYVHKFDVIEIEIRLDMEQNVTSSSVLMRRRPAHGQRFRVAFISKLLNQIKSIDQMKLNILETLHCTRKCCWHSSHTLRITNPKSDIRSPFEN